jgi:methylenetetrahydrofolate dehydrogenase (NADP+)/methenyltetrahydrofolate cyclohydrolase
MQLLDGRQMAKELRLSLQKTVENLSIKPHLAVLQVGNDLASSLYVHHKKIAAAECGFRMEIHRLPTTATTTNLQELITRLNNRVDGIVIQLPLPKQVNTHAVIMTLDPSRDVDGLHPLNVGLLASGGGIPTGTAAACLKILKSVHTNLAGKHAVVIGRSAVCGRPLAQLLLRENCLVTIAHSGVSQLEIITRLADIVVVAVGKARFITRHMLRSCSVVVDVGINRQEDGRLVGDVAAEELADLEGFLTPVPGGVGPVTVACLLENTYKSFYHRHFGHLTPSVF